MGLPKRCIDLTPAQIGRALASSTAMGALLRHMARIAKPGEGAPKILVPIARMASNECDWIEGGLTVEITSAAGKTVILVAVELGLDMRELLFPRLSLEVSNDEFSRVLENAPQLVYPMKCKQTTKSIVLTCAEEVVGTLAPPSFASSEEGVRSVLPAKLRRSLAPIAADPAPLAHGASMKVDTGPVGEVAILARLAPKALRAPKITELEALDLGWDVGAYSSSMNTRETKPPPPGATAPSTSPTRPPMPGSRKKSQKPSAKPPPPAKGPARPALRRTSKRPAKPRT